MEAIDTGDAPRSGESSQYVEWNGKKLPVTAPDPACRDRERGRIEAELAEFSSLGVEVTAVAVPERGGAPRYTFKFPTGELQYRSRIALERAGFDIGQHLADTGLGFYVSRRAQRSEGWSV